MKTHAQETFEFLYHSLILLDHQESELENFHLIFLIKLSRFLGFGAHESEEILGGRMLDRQEEALLQQLVTADFTDTIAMSNAQRRNLLDTILKFYAEHIDSLGEIKSIQILKTVME